MARVKPVDNNKQIGYYGIQSPEYELDFITDNIKQIGTELTCLAYDSEDRRRQHKNYLDHVKEYDVREPRPCPNLDDHKVYASYFDNLKVEHTGAEHVLDALLLQIENFFPDEAVEKRTSFLETIDDVRRQTHPSLASIIGDLGQLELLETGKNNPFYCCLEDKYVLEHQDDLWRCMQTAIDPSFAQYNFRLNSLIAEWELNRFLQDVPTWNTNLLKSFVNSQREYLNLEYLLNVLHLRGVRSPNYSVDCDEAPETPSDKIAEMLDYFTKSNLQINEHIELLTRQALQQQLINSLKTFDFVKHEVNPLTNCLIITFWNSDDVIQTSEFEEHLTTKLCFRDYVDYIIDEESDWLVEQEEEYDHQHERDGAGRLGNKSLGAPLPDLVAKEFLVNRSLKKHGNDGFEGDSEPPTVLPPVAEEPEKKKEKEKKGDKKKQKNIATIPSVASVPAKENKHTEGLKKKLNQKQFIGYNLDDRRFQVNGERLVYRTAICTIRYELLKWLYRERSINIEVDVNGTRLLFGHKFNIKGRNLENIDNVLVKCRNHKCLTFEIVVQDPVRIISRSPSLENIPANCKPSDHSIVDPDPRELVLRYVWPTGLTVKTLKNTKYYAIEQMWVNPDSEEKGRVMHANGCVVIYFTTGKLRFCSSNGMIIETGSDGEWDEEEAYVKKLSVVESRFSGN